MTSLMDIPWRDPLVAFAPLADEPWSLAFISSGSHPQAKWSILCADPDDVHQANGQQALNILAKAKFDFQQNPKWAHFPFIGGLAGLLGYELGAALENRETPAAQDWPDLALGHFPCCALFDHHSKKAWVLGPDHFKAKQFAATLGDDEIRRCTQPLLDRFQTLESDETIANKVRQTISYIRAGDIFQANISRGYQARLPKKDNPFSLFEQMIRLSAAPFTAYFRLDKNRAVLSNSPERFLSVDRSGHIETHPIKGTRPRGKTKSRDEELARELLLSTKDRAENLMIVDLMRNDLSRVCEPGTVEVPHLFALQSYANVHHLVSIIRGKLSPNVTPADVLKASFPPGSITGAPKIRAMQIIQELEHELRGPYCGAMGYLSAHGQMDFNVLIRTMRLDQKINGDWDVLFRAGGGIVADSDPDEETREMNTKASVFARLAGTEI